MSGHSKDRVNYQFNFADTFVFINNAFESICMLFIFYLCCVLSPGEAVSLTLRGLAS